MRAVASQTIGTLVSFSRRQWVTAGAGAIVAALVTGLPTDVVPNPFYTRMTPVLWWSYPVWAAAAILSGLVLATYVRGVRSQGTASASVGGGLLSFLAVGCPVCNKAVVALLGVGGALSIFAPMQPYLAGVGLALLFVSLGVRLRRLDRCPAVVGAGPQVGVPSPGP